MLQPQQSDAELGTRYILNHSQSSPTESVASLESKVEQLERKYELQAAKHHELKEELCQLRNRAASSDLCGSTNYERRTNSALYWEPDEEIHRNRAPFVSTCSFDVVDTKTRRSFSEAHCAPAKAYPSSDYRIPNGLITFRQQPNRFSADLLNAATGISASAVTSVRTSQPHDAGLAFSNLSSETTQLLQHLAIQRQQTQSDDIERKILPTVDCAYDASSLRTKADQMSTENAAGRLFRAKYAYRPCTDSPNANPESELSLEIGDLLLVYGVDEDGFFDAQLLNGSCGLVPSNFVERVPDYELFESLPSTSAMTSSHKPNAPTTPQVLATLPSRMQLAANDAFSVLSPKRPYSLTQQLLPERELIEVKKKSSFFRRGVSFPSSWPREEAESSQQLLGSTMRRADPRLQTTINVSTSTANDSRILSNAAPVCPCPYPTVDVSGVTVIEVRQPEGTRVPFPRDILIERQLTKSVLISWSPPENAIVPVSQYHVCVDGMVKTIVPGSYKTKALVEDVDVNKEHRISVRAVTDAGHSLDASCAIIVGKDASVAPRDVRVANVTPVSAQLSWYSSNSNYEHLILLNGLKVASCPPAVSQILIKGLIPSTMYRCSVRLKNPKAVLEDKPVESFVDFKTLPKIGLPDAPSDVRCELGPQDGTLLVTWSPVQNQPKPPSRAAVAGYLLFADGKNIKEVESPNGDHLLLRMSDFLDDPPLYITVRTKTREGAVSGDSNVVRVPRGILTGSGLLTPSAPSVRSFSCLGAHEAVKLKLPSSAPASTYASPLHLQQQQPLFQAASAAENRTDERPALTLSANSRNTAQHLLMVRDAYANDFPASIGTGKETHGAQSGASYCLDPWLNGNYESIKDQPSNTADQLQQQQMGERLARSNQAMNVQHSPHGQASLSHSPKAAALSSQLKQPSQLLLADDQLQSQIEQQRQQQTYYVFHPQLSKPVELSTTHSKSMLQMEANYLVKHLAFSPNVRTGFDTVAAQNRNLPKINPATRRPYSAGQYAHLGRQQASLATSAVEGNEQPSFLRDEQQERRRGAIAAWRSVEGDAAMRRRAMRKRSYSAEVGQPTAAELLLDSAGWSKRRSGRHPLAAVMAPTSSNQGECRLRHPNRFDQYAVADNGGTTTRRIQRSKHTHRAQSEPDLRFDNIGLLNSERWLAEEENEGEESHLNDMSNQMERNRFAYKRRPYRPFVALFDYSPGDMSPNPNGVFDELSFEKGQLIKIFGEKDFDGFFEGELNGRRGYVPGNLVCPLDLKSGSALYREGLQLLENSADVRQVYGREFQRMNSAVGLLQMRHANNSDPSLALRHSKDRARASYATGADDRRDQTYASQRRGQLKHKSYSLDYDAEYDRSGDEYGSSRRHFDQFASLDRRFAATAPYDQVLHASEADQQRQEQQRLIRHERSRNVAPSRDSPRNADYDAFEVSYADVSDRSSRRRPFETRNSHVVRKTMLPTADEHLRRRMRRFLDGERSHSLDHYDTTPVSQQLMGPSMKEGLQNRRNQVDVDREFYFQQPDDFEDRSDVDVAIPQHRSGRRRNSYAMDAAGYNDALRGTHPSADANLLAYERDRRYDEMRAHRISSARDLPEQDRVHDANDHRSSPRQRPKPRPLGNGAYVNSDHQSVYSTKHGVLPNECGEWSDGNRTRSSFRSAGRDMLQQNISAFIRDAPASQMVALYDYDPRESSPNVDAEQMELTFRAGEIITVYGEIDEDGFFVGELDGRRGLVPSNFLASDMAAAGGDALATFLPASATSASSRAVTSFETSDSPRTKKDGVTFSDSTAPGANTSAHSPTQAQRRRADQQLQSATTRSVTVNTSDAQIVGGAQSVAKAQSSSKQLQGSAHAAKESATGKSTGPATGAAKSSGSGGGKSSAATGKAASKKTSTSTSPGQQRKTSTTPKAIQSGAKASKASR